jgi:hypothetical protein
MFKGGVSTFPRRLLGVRDFCILDSFCFNLSGTSDPAIGDDIDALAAGTLAAVVNRNQRP